MAIKRAVVVSSFSLIVAVGACGNSSEPVTGDSASANDSAPASDSASANDSASPSDSAPAGDAASDSVPIPDASVDDADGDASVIAGLLASLAVPMCARTERCDPIGWGARNVDRDACERVQRRVLETWLLPLGAMVDAQRVRYDADAAQACIDALNGGGCDGTNALTDLLGERSSGPCTDLFVGLVDNGGPCTASNECAPGLVCGNCVGVACLLQLWRNLCGSCRPRDAQGEACVEGVGGLVPVAQGSCAAGLACVSEGEVATCWPADRKLDQTCGTAATGLCEGADATCVWDAPEGPPGHCRALVEVGGSCGDQMYQPRCGPDSMCLEGLCRAPVLRDERETCDRPETVCRAGLACDDVMCQPAGELGDACSSIAACPDTGFCDGTQCVARKASGEPCRVSIECAAPNRCLGPGDQRVCAPLTWTPCAAR